MPYKDLVKAREAKRISAAKRRAAAGEAEREAEREADRKRKAADASPEVVRIVRMTDLGQQKVGDPAALPHDGGLRDTLNYQAGHEYGGKPRRGTYVSYRTRWKQPGPPLPVITGRMRRRAAWAEVRRHRGLTRQEGLWAVYVLLRLPERSWERAPTWAQGDAAVREARAIETALFGLRQEVIACARAIRSTLESQPATPADIQARLGPPAADFFDLFKFENGRLEFRRLPLHRALDSLKAAGLLQVHRAWDGGEVVGYSIRTG